eukprot:CAMPEP_0174994124 /NCGR_PEP_ID=MMETSP0004_2-20121128/23447_1 /TAXON_ID=420556 /ORGANISM="Ochromonas sp., Strain CCMP1393" /LENGTH=44 /DNA_ID= /DNA_START= /DNA_END= /DNA_ORIENTATION=
MSGKLVLGTVVVPVAAVAAVAAAVALLLATVAFALGMTAAEGGA